VSLLFAFSLKDSNAFADSFDGIGFDSALWDVYENGGITWVNDGIANLSKVGISDRFPYVSSKNMSLGVGSKVSLRYKIFGSYNYGAGLVFRQGALSNGQTDESYSSSNLIQVWPINKTGTIALAVRDLCGVDEVDCLRPYRLLKTWQIDDNWHLLEVAQVSAGVFGISDESGLLFTSRNTSNEITNLWFGNPEVTPFALNVFPSIQLDYVKVEPVGDVLNVIDYKQYDPAWKDEEYDHASSWARNVGDTIERWGCALTSAAMVLDYHGYPVNPSTLNDWLRSQVDGYLRNGLVNWLAISRYTRLFPNNVNEALEYTRYPANDFDQLNIELSENRPVVLGLPGHFVVGKGDVGDTYAINDPDSEAALLSDFGNHFNSLGSYVPSNTDLSYVLLVVDADKEISVVDGDGLPVNYQVFDDSSIIDDIDGAESSGDPVKTLYWPKPVDGEYFVAVVGDGGFSVDVYLYDEVGDVSVEGFVITENGRDDLFLLNIGGDSKIRSKVTFESLYDDLNFFYKSGVIKKEGVYKFFVKQLKIVEMLTEHGKRGNLVATRVLLRNIQHQLWLFSPRFIDDSAAEYLKEQVDVLRDGLPLGIDIL